MKIDRVVQKVLKAGPYGCGNYGRTGWKMMVKFKKGSNVRKRKIICFSPNEKGLENMITTLWYRFLVGMLKKVVTYSCIVVILNSVGQDKVKKEQWCDQRRRAKRREILQYVEGNSKQDHSIS